MRKPTQKDVIDKPNIQLDEQNVQTATGESGDGVEKNPTNDANVNEFNCKTQTLILTPRAIFFFLYKKSTIKKTSIHLNDSVQSNAAAGCRVRHAKQVTVHDIQNNA